MTCDEVIMKVNVFTAVGQYTVEILQSKLFRKYPCM